MDKYFQSFMADEEDYDEKLERLIKVESARLRNYKPKHHLLESDPKDIHMPGFESHIVLYNALKDAADKAEKEFFELLEKDAERAKQPTLQTVYPGKYDLLRLNDYDPTVDFDLFIDP